MDVVGPIVFSHAGLTLQQHVGVTDGGFVRQGNDPFHIAAFGHQVVDYFFFADDFKRVHIDELIRHRFTVPNQFKVLFYRFNIALDFLYKASIHFGLEIFIVQINAQNPQKTPGRFRSCAVHRNAVGDDFNSHIWIKVRPGEAPFLHPDGFIIPPFQERILRRKVPDIRHIVLTSLPVPYVFNANARTQLIGSQLWCDIRCELKVNLNNQIFCFDMFKQQLLQPAAL